MSAGEEASGRRLGLVLRGATGLAAAAFAISLLWSATRGWSGAAGAAVLLGAPFLVTVLAGVLYGRRGEWRVAGLAAVLLVILCTGAWIAA